MDLSNINQDISELLSIKADLERQVLDLSDKKFMDDFSLHDPEYKFGTQEQYKSALADVRHKQKKMIKDGTAIVCTVEWAVKGDTSTGKELTDSILHTSLQVFNLESNRILAKLRFNNYDIAKDRIISIFSSINSRNSPINIFISKKYLRLKLDELEILYGFAQKRKEDADRRREEREILKEQEAVERELLAEMEKLEKEKEHYTNYLESLIEQSKRQHGENIDIISGKIEETKVRLIEINHAISDVDYRRANMRAGYVYVISNIGSFGEGVYKIGMTRRLNPLDRIDELGGASVPFRFDVHALIFSDDAPKLESTLHKIFSRNRVNKINGRKEFFKVPLAEIEQAVRDNFDNTIEFNYTPDAEQYRESLLM